MTYSRSLIPTLQKAIGLIGSEPYYYGLYNTKIIIYDHNCDRPDYPQFILNDAAPSAYVDGSAFHLYGGDINVLSTIHGAYPSKNLYFTQQYTSSTGSFSCTVAVFTSVREFHVDS